MNGKILTIAGSDPSGGAGIQADIKTITALGGYAMAAITTLTVQNTRQVFDVHPVDAALVAAQIEAILSDIPPDVFKVGMMGTADITAELAQIFSNNADIPLILDPVILSTSGHPLLDDRGIEILISDIFPLIDLLTPNLAEASKLCGMAEISTLAHMARAGQSLREMGPSAVLVKGGHLSGEVVTDILVTSEGITEFTSPKIHTRNTHGTGCTLASAIATGVGQGLNLKDAITRAHDYVHLAIKHAPGFGQGQGPLNHWAPSKSFD